MVWNLPLVTLCGGDPPGPWSGPPVHPHRPPTHTNPEAQPHQSRPWAAAGSLRPEKPACITQESLAVKPPSTLTQAQRPLAAASPPQLSSQGQVPLKCSPHWATTVSPEQKAKGFQPERLPPAPAQYVPLEHLLLEPHWAPLEPMALAAPTQYPVNKLLFSSGEDSGLAPPRRPPGWRGLREG